MIESVTEQMHGSNWVSDLKRITSGPWLVCQNLQLERNGALFGVHGLVRSKSAWRERALSERRCYANFAMKWLRLNQRFGSSVHDPAEVARDACRLAILPKVSTNSSTEYHSSFVWQVCGQFAGRTLPNVSRPG